MSNLNQPHPYDREPARGFAGVLRKLGVVFGTIAILALVFIGISILGKMRPEPEKKEVVIKAPAVFVKEAVYEDIALSVTAQGEVRPRTEINLTTQVGGKVISVANNFVDGGVISKGDILLRIEDADFRVAVAQADARVAQAAQALNIAEAEAELAKADFEELGGLENGAAPSALTLRQPQLAQAEANYQAALADRENARLNLARANVTAPFDGRVRTTNANLGQFITPGFSLGQIFATDIAEIRLPLSDEDLTRLDLPIAFTATSKNKGPKVKLSSTVAGKFHEWQGHIVRTDAAYDPSTRQIAAIAQVIDPYGAGAHEGFPLAIGLFVAAEIEGLNLTSAVVLPRVALSGQGSVFVIDDKNIVRERPVTIAAITERGAIVTSGIENGENVIISRLAGIGPGEEVTPVNSKGETIAPINDPADTEENSTDEVATTEGTENASSTPGGQP